MSVIRVCLYNTLASYVWVYSTEICENIRLFLQQTRNRRQVVSVILGRVPKDRHIIIISYPFTIGYALCDMDFL